MSMSYDSVRDFLFREARYLDDKQWDQWLELYAADATFWMPSWDDDDELTEDPQSEISLIWYGSRDGLEDRIFRIKTERSSATIPDTRHSKSITNLEVLEQTPTSAKVRFNWITNTFRYDILDTYFGYSEYTIDTSGEKPLIKKKYVVLKNDYIHHVLDIYHI